MKAILSVLSAAAIATIALGAGCKSKADSVTDKSVAQGPAQSEGAAADEAEPEMKPDVALEGAMGGAPGRTRRGGQYAMKKADEDGDDFGADTPMSEEERVPADGKNEVAEVQSRAWFPETFLFEPRVVTDESGHATVTAAVPDRLTTWRVLALAHARSGVQAGAVATFLGTLDTYVDLVVPPALRVGDRVELPVQAINTTGTASRATVDLKATGAVITGGGPVALAAQSTTPVRATLVANEPGTAQVLARLGGKDAVTRTIPVVPRGREVTVRQSGTLAKPAQVSLAIPADARGRFARVSIYSGARAVLSQELAASASRGGLWNDAFALVLIGRAPQLLKKFGMEVDAEALRRARILVTQRVVRQATSMGATYAVVLARGTAGHDDPILRSIGKRAASVIEQEQAPDGSCGGADGWTLQRLLVATAECAQAVPDNRRVVLRAGGAIERHSPRIADPYTAAAVLASGLASDAEQARLRELIEKAAVSRGSGRRVIKVPPGVLRSSGDRPSELEATALAVLALPDGPLRSELGASVLAGYPAQWADGQTSMVAMEAVLALFSDPLPSSVTVELVRDDQVVAKRSIAPKQAGTVAVLEHRDAADDKPHRWSVRAEPAIPGLAFDFEMKAYAPWPEMPPKPGLELQVTPPKAPTVGRAAEITVRGLAPARGLTVRIELPAGVVADQDDLERRRDRGELSGFRAVDGRVELDLPAPKAGAPFAAAVRVIPTMAGGLWSGAAHLDVGGEKSVRVVRPVRWTIRR